jgi:hypothetical protein
VFDFRNLSEAVIAPTHRTEIGIVKALCFLCLLLLLPRAGATKMADKPLDELVHGASDIAIAHVEKMSGRINSGMLITKGEFRTGPGLRNTAIASLRIIEILKGTELHKNTVLPVELDSAWHMKMNLSAPLDKEHNVIVFLKHSSTGLVPVYAPEPYRGDYLELEVRDLLSLQHSD